MHLALAQATQSVQNLEVVMVLAVIIVATFWRILLRLALAALVAALIVALAYGAATIMDAARSL
jgi:hypothetical protein